MENTGNQYIDYANANTGCQFELNNTGGPV